jgi:hypothetical protein
MPCLICGVSKTIDAHLIPRAFALEVTSKAGEKHAIAHPGQRRFHTTNTGAYDNSILCGGCDGLLGRHEGYVFNCLRQVRAQMTPAGQIVNAARICGNAFVKFAAGVCWKYCVTRPEYGRIDIGPYVKILADTAFECTAIPDSLDATAIQLQSGDGDVYFYRTPMPDRKDGVNVVRFCVGGFVFLLKIDKRPNPPSLPSECWLKGKSTASFAVAPAQLFEEWQLHAGIRAGDGVQAYFKRMLAKSPLRP